MSSTSPSSDTTVPLRESHGRIVRFLGKGLAFYALWYLLYDLWLLPDGRLDLWVSLSVVEVGQSFLTLFGVEVVADSRTLAIPGEAGIRIVDGCNGLSTIGLFIGFVLAFPGRAFRRAVFIPLGIAVIYMSNVARVVGLLLLQQYWSPGFDFIHGLGAPAFFYLIVFGLWVLWANYGGRASPSSSSDVESARPAVA